MKNEASYLSHTQGKKHQRNLQRHAQNLSTNNNNTDKNTKSSKDDNSKHDTDKVDMKESVDEKQNTYTNKEHDNSNNSSITKSIDTKLAKSAKSNLLNAITDENLGKLKKVPVNEIHIVSNLGSVMDWIDLDLRDIDIDVDNNYNGNKKELKYGNLFLSPKSATNEQFHKIFASENIKTVISLSNKAVSKENECKNVEYYHFEILDKENCDISKYFDKTYDIISNAIFDKKESILVHCDHGVSRSASIVIAFVIRCKKISFDDAYKLVKKCRREINPNKSFVKQLVKYSEKFVVQKMVAKTE